MVETSGQLSHGVGQQHDDWSIVGLVTSMIEFSATEMPI